MLVYGYICTGPSEANTSGIEANLSESIRTEVLMLSKIYIDHLTIARPERSAWRDLLRVLVPGDLVFVPRVDMIGSEYADIVRNWQVLTKEKGVDVVVLDFPVLDTRNRHDLVGTFQNDVMLAVCTFVKMQEREKRRVSQERGIEAAKQRGVQFGRPLKDLPENFVEQVERYRRKQATLRECAAACNMPPTSFFRRMKRMERSSGKDSG